MFCNAIQTKILCYARTTNNINYTLSYVNYKNAGLFYKFWELPVMFYFICDEAKNGRRKESVVPV